MKSPLLFALLLLSNALNGQTSVYTPFPTSFGNWIYRYHDDFGFPTSQTTQYTISGDTVISIVNYKRVFVNTFYKGALRESSKVVYFVPDTANSEYILYDFNLIPGDSIIHPFGGAWCTNDTLTVLYIDSVLLSDGFHRQYHFDPIAPIWIEGVGSSCYLLEPLQVLCVSGNDAIECMQSDTSINYPATYSSCVLSIDDEYAALNTILISPNPLQGSTTINFGHLQVREIFISDLQGKIVFKQIVNEQSQIEINDIGKGLYILTAIDSNNRSVRIKILRCS